MRETRPCGNTIWSCATGQSDTWKEGETRSCDIQHGHVELGFFEPNSFINRVFRFLFSFVH